MGRQAGKLIGFPNATAFTDRHGKVRWRYRRKGARTVYLPGLPGSPEFAAAYADAVSGVTSKREIGASRVLPGTIEAAIVSFYKSAEYATLGDATKTTYRGIIERFRTEYGAFKLHQLTRERVLAIRDKKAATPAAANNLLRMIRLLFKHAIDRGLARTDPTERVKPLRVAGDGFHTWTEDEIASYEARWPVGTRERRGFDLLLYTGQRSGDVRLMGRHSLSAGRVVVRQAKTGARLAIPVHPRLQASLDAAPADLMLLQTAQGAPFTAKGFGNWFSASCDAAGVPHCSAHGLRKAAARRLAEAGCSASEIASVTGHRSLREVERYVRAASQTLLADAAMRRVESTHGEQAVATLPEKVANRRRNPSRRKESS